MATVQLVGTASTYAYNAASALFTLQRYTAIATGLGTSFKVRCRVAGNVKVAVYENNAGEPGALITAMDTGQAVSVGWNTLTFNNSAIISGNPYWLAFCSDTAGAVAYTTTGNTYVRTKAATYSTFTFPNPAGAGFTTPGIGLYSIAIWGELPLSITNCDDEDLLDDETVNLTGVNLSGTTVVLELGDAATYGACTTKVTQTINSNDGSTINFTVVKGALDYGINYLYVTRDGFTSDGYSINLYAELDIATYGSPIYTGFTGNSVTGAHFGTTQGSSKLYLCDQADALGLNVEQTVTSWSDTEIIFTAVKDGLSVGTNYLVVSRDNADLGDTSARLSPGHSTELADPPTRLTYKHFLENGGGTVAHLWHVAGYPWAVTDSQELVDALADTGQLIVQYARKRLFGTNALDLYGGTVYPAYSVPIFATLKKDFGDVKFELDESNGLLKGGSWSVKIEDKDLGHTWDHAVSEDEIFGLEGLHRIANVKISEVHGWAYLRSNFVRASGGFEGSQISVEEQSSGILFDRIDGLDPGEYRVLWMNHEAMAATSIDSGTYPEYVIQLSERGLYRSRKQDHFTDALKGLNPIIADVPGDITGHYCWLYSIPLINGQLVLTTGNIPLIVEEMRGVVSPNMSTSEGVTYISIREEFAALERTIDTSYSRNAETGMKGFFFSRGDSPSGSNYYGDDDSELIFELKQKMQAPHLIIREFDYSYKVLADKYKESFEGFDGGELIILRKAAKDELESKCDFNMVERYIWLCPKNSTIFFETVDQVIDALNWELAKLHHGLGGANSEDTELTHSWNVANINNRYGIVSNDETEDREYLKNHIAVNDWPTQQALHGYVTGPLAWVFALGNLVGNPGTTIYDNITSKNSNDRIDGYSKLETVSLDIFDTCIIPWKNAISQTLWMVPVDSKMGNYKDEIVWESRYNNVFNQYLKNFGMEIAKPQYYIGWNWVNYPAQYDLDHDIAVHNNGIWNICIDSTVDTNSFVEGDILFLGDGRRIPRFYGTIDEVVSIDGYDNIKRVALDPQYLIMENGEVFPHGMSLFYLPLLEIFGDDDSDLSISDLDPHRLKKALTIETSILSYIFRVLLGETIGGINIANEIQVATCPFFTTVEDFTSSIDWSSLDGLGKIQGQHYIAPLETGDSVKGILKNELLFHRAHMTREFDSAYLMWRYRFAPIGPINASWAALSGFHLDGNKALSGPPEESHGFGELYNAISISFKDEDEDEGDVYVRFEQMNSPIVGTDARRTLKIEPKISKIPTDYEDLSDADKEALVAAFRPLLEAISRSSVVQEKGITLFQYLFPVGREIRVTDITARRPFTHRLGLDVEPAKVIASSWSWKKCSGTITYKLGNSFESAQYGYAPACKLETGNFSKAVGSFSGVPNDYEFGDQTKDIHYFDCINIGDPGNPHMRDCACGDYAVWALEVGTPGWTPLEFTCAVDLETGVLTLTGDVTDIDEGEDYVIIFRSWEDLEPCQKIWVTHADDSNTIGVAALPPHRWV
jgi:hypothetical protein